MHVAVIIPAWNIAPYLSDAIQSVLAQTHTDWALTVVDDGSTDHTAAVAAGFTDPRVRLIRQTNGGVSAARNCGVEAFLLYRTDLSGLPGASPGAEGTREVLALPELLGVRGAESGPTVVVREPDAFLFLDGDDWLAPHALSVLVETLSAAPWAVASCAPYARVAADGRHRVHTAPADGDLLEQLLTRNLFANGGHVLIRRNAIEAVGAFRSDLRYGEDWEFWTRLALLGEFVAVRSRLPSLYVRERPGSAYLSNATNPASYGPVLDAIHRNPDAIVRLQPCRLGGLRRRAEAEVAWTIGRELIRHGQVQAGLPWLARSIRRCASVKRLALIATSWLRLGPFRPYQSVA